MKLLLVPAILLLALPGATVRFADAFDAEVLGRCGPDNGLFHLRLSGDPFALLDAHGHVPLPPYHTHADEEDDVRRYQTVFNVRMQQHCRRSRSTR